MSKRLTADWTTNSEEAFGLTGAIGDKGEQFVVDYLRQQKYQVIHYPDNREKQIRGIDGEIIIRPNETFTFDVKANIKVWAPHTFYVEPYGWLTKQPDLILHCNVELGIVVGYDRLAMLEYCQQHKHNFWVARNGSTLLTIHDYTNYEFISKL